MKTVNIGIFAHVDAGKTTLSEALLLAASAIRTPGSLDRGTAHTDRTDVERRRGISVRAVSVPLAWKNTRVNLIDTPGHGDFAAEVERSMWALDMAVLVLSGVDGVEPQSELLFESLRRQRIPTLIFVNKMDREGADFSAVLKQTRALLSGDAAEWSDDESLMAALADESEAAMEDYLSGTVYPREKLACECAALFRACRLTPVFSGSALKNQGVKALLDAITALADGAPDSSDAVCGVVFALDEDAAMGRGAYVRMFSGALKNRDLVAFTVTREGAYGLNQHTEERKITQIRDIAAEGRGHDLGALGSGEIGVVYGLGDVRVGYVIGSAALLPRDMGAGRLKEPLLMARVMPENEDQRPALHRALMLLSAEDPLLDVRSFMGDLHIRMMGVIQAEILTEELKSRFGLNVSFAEAQVVYRETIREEAIGYCAYTMPKPCWAVLKFIIRPAPRGSGVSYHSEVPVRQIKERYQHQVEQGLQIPLRQGMLGWQVDDVDITLIDGSDHQFHTHPLDFIVATPMAIMDGLRRGGTVLLEPVAALNIRVPADMGGRIMSEVVAMRGEVTATETDDSRGAMLLTAEAPLRAVLDFPTRLAALSGGRGSLTMRVHRYQPCAEEHVCPRAGVNPLDTAKYILAARSALESDIF